MTIYFRIGGIHSERQRVKRALGERRNNIGAVTVPVLGRNRFGVFEHANGEGGVDIKVKRYWARATNGRQTIDKFLQGDKEAYSFGVSFKVKGSVVAKVGNENTVVLLFQASKSGFVLGGVLEHFVRVLGVEKIRVHYLERQNHWNATFMQSCFPMVHVCGSWPSVKGSTVFIVAGR